MDDDYPSLASYDRLSFTETETSCVSKKKRGHPSKMGDYIGLISTRRELFVLDHEEYLLRERKAKVSCWKDILDER